MQNFAGCTSNTCMAFGTCAHADLAHSFASMLC